MGVAKKHSALVITSIGLRRVTLSLTALVLIDTLHFLALIDMLHLHLVLVPYISIIYMIYVFIIVGYTIDIPYWIYYM